MAYLTRRGRVWRLGVASVLAVVFIVLVGPWGAGIRERIDGTGWIRVPAPGGGVSRVRGMPTVPGLLNLVILVGGSGCLSGVLFWSALKKRGAAPPGSGLCERCGYDLRSSEGRCPECGALVWVDRGGKG